MFSFGSLAAPLAAPLALPVQALVARADAWSVESHQVARRNAMIANTALAARRRDREDVDRYLARLSDEPSDERDDAGSGARVRRG